MSRVRRRSLDLVGIRLVVRGGMMFKSRCKRVNGFTPGSGSLTRD